MAILSLVLYGSRARRDEDSASDIDLFAISDDLEYRMIVKGSANVASYPRTLALERATQGDLFMLHIVSESQTLYDPSGNIEQLKKEFTYRPSYDSEIQFASDIAWMLVDHAQSTDNFSFINRRIAWCVRTILIARAANLRVPIFSAKSLAEFSGSQLTLSLIKSKGYSGPRPESINELEDFIKQFGKDRPTKRASTSLHDYALIFADTQNVMGTKTLTMLQSSAEDFYA
ncbi:TPA: nucleotidyltransferase domain-containing protein [Burkholderia vietnamiensis]|nr:nucleotidyltransferase domain-containing protein [Burkholderia vietnamiensis]